MVIELGVPPFGCAVSCSRQSLLFVAFLLASCGLSLVRRILDGDLYAKEAAQASGVKSVPSTSG